MKHVLFVFALVFWLAPLAAQTKPTYTTSYGSTVSNADSDPAPYIPDDRLGYGDPGWPEPQRMTQETDNSIAIQNAYNAGVAAGYDAGFYPAYPVYPAGGFRR